MKLANSISQRNLLSLGYGSGVLLVPINCPSWWLEDTILTGISAMTAGSRGDEDQLCCRAPQISCISKSIDVGENNSYIVAGTCLWLDVIRIVQDYGRIVEFWCKLSDEWGELEIWSQGRIRINSEITFCKHDSVYSDKNETDWFPVQHRTMVRMLRHWDVLGRTCPSQDEQLDVILYDLLYWLASWFLFRKYRCPHLWDDWVWRRQKRRETPKERRIMSG